MPYDDCGLCRISNPTLFLEDHLGYNLTVIHIPVTSQDRDPARTRELVQTFRNQDCLIARSVSVRPFNEWSRCFGRHENLMRARFQARLQGLIS